jgi:hypothetical protein
LQVVLGGGMPAADGGDSADEPAPMLEECAQLSCNGRGACDDASGKLECECDLGYASARCGACDQGFHRDALGQCVSDQLCVQGACGEHGVCSDAGGVITCACDPGHAGAGCDVCAPGFHLAGTGCVLDELCLANTCAGHGTCAASNGQTRCVCQPGYTAAHCDSCALGFHRDAGGACAVDEACSGDECGAHGDCVDTSGVIECACHAGYTGAACARCAAGFHVDGDACVLDLSCLPTSCSSHASCDATGGVVQCVCDAGYQGVACGECLPGYHLDYATHACAVFDCNKNPVAGPGALDFEGLAGYPTAQNTCTQSSVQVIEPVTFTSLAGDGSVWMCAPSGWSKISSQHVMLEAGTVGTARLRFAGPISALSFRYGAYTALSLRLLGDGQLLGTLSAPLMTAGAQALSFAAPISVLELESANGSTNVIAIDDLAYAPPECP